MTSINVNELYEEIIPLPNESSSATLPYTIYTESDKATLVTGNTTHIVGIHWKISFTPLVEDEIYILEVKDSASEIIFSKAYKALTNVVDAVEGINITICKTEIVNKALTLIGAAPITSLTDDTNNANIMSRVYKSALRALLSECCWNFATRRALLTLSSTVPSWYYTNEAYVYAKPSDCIRIFGTNDDYAKWRDEGDYILSDTSGLGIKYVFYNDVPYKFPAFFVEAFVDLLAAQACFMILNQSSKAEAMLQKYQSISLPNARSENAQTGTQQYLRDDAWEFAKYNNENPEA